MPLNAPGWSVYPLTPSHSRGCCWAGLKLPTVRFAHQDPHLWRKRLLA